MLSVAKAGLAIIAGGLVLGGLLGHVADPQMKSPPEPSWRTALQDDAAPQVAAQLEVEMLIPFGGFRAEPDFVVAEDRRELDQPALSPMQAGDPWGNAGGYSAEFFPSPGPNPSPADAERAATAAERSASDAGLEATQRPSPPPQAAERFPAIGLEPIPGNP